MQLLVIDMDFQLQINVLSIVIRLLVIKSFDTGF